MPAQSRVIETLSLRSERTAWHCISKGGFAQPLVVFILLVILAVVLFNFKNITNRLTSLTPPPPDYQNVLPEWNTYQNRTYRFYIKYPDTWFVRTFGDYAANFQVTNPKLGEATPGAIRVKFSALTERADQDEFEKIVKSDPKVGIYEPLDVQSIITKVKNFEVNKNKQSFSTNRGVEYTVNRRFSALEGPRGQFTHVYSLSKNGVVLKFFSSADTLEEEQKFDAIFQKMITTLRL